MIEPLKTPNLADCKRFLAKLYNSSPNMVISMKVEILELLGYGEQHGAIGALLSGQANLKNDGTIEFHAAVMSEDGAKNR